jgi:hypothetical protein
VRADSAHAVERRYLDERDRAGVALIRAFAHLGFARRSFSSRIFHVDLQRPQE